MSDPKPRTMYDEMMEGHRRQIASESVSYLHAKFLTFIGLCALFGLWPGAVGGLVVYGVALLRRR